MDNKLFLIWGQDPYLIEEKLKKLIVQINLEAAEEAELVFIDADEVSPSHLAELLDFSPLFSARRIIVIKRPFWLAKSKRKNSKIEETARVWSNYLKTQAADQYIILTSTEYSSTNSIIKTLGKNLAIIECKKLDPGQLKKWIADQFVFNNHKADASVIALLASTGQDMYYLKNLIEKTCLTVFNRNITENDIKDDLIRIENTTVFKITDELFRRNHQMAIKNLHQYIEQEMPVIVALFMIVKQFSNFGKVKYYRSKGYSSQEIADKTKLQGFQVRNMEKYISNFTDEELRKVFAVCLQADLDLKTTSKDHLLIMESLIYEICLNS